jgi:hypothetical protein
VLEVAQKKFLWAVISELESSAIMTGRGARLAETSKGVENQAVK